MMQTLLVHQLNDIRQAIVFLARVKEMFQLSTPPNALCYYGVGCMKQWQNAAKDTPLIIGAGRDSALAHEALKQGIRHLYCAAPTLQLQRLKHIAHTQSATLYEDYPKQVVDIRDRGWEEQITQTNPLP